MKGDVSPVVYLVAAVIITVGILALSFFLGFRPFSLEASASHCKNQILKACGKYEMSGKMEFGSIPSTCANVVKDQVSPDELEKCKNGDASACQKLCDWIKTGG